MARLSPSRHTLHCRLRFLDRRAGRPSPLRTTFCCTALAICHSRRLPTQRRRRSDPSATSQTRSRPCDDASSSLSPRPSRDALVATPRSARHYEFPITDAVRLKSRLDRFLGNRRLSPNPLPPRLFTDPSERETYRRPSAREELISFETISLLLNWLQLGVLLVILFRLGHTFSLIANTQRELRRTIKRLGEQRATELNGVGGLGNVPSPRS